MWHHSTTPKRSIQGDLLYQQILGICKSASPNDSDQHYTIHQIWFFLHSRKQILIHVVKHHVKEEKMHTYKWMYMHWRVNTLKQTNPLSTWPSHKEIIRTTAPWWYSELQWSLNITNSLITIYCLQSFSISLMLLRFKSSKFGFTMIYFSNLCQSENWITNLVTLPEAKLSVQYNNTYTFRFMCVSNGHRNNYTTMYNHLLYNIHYATYSCVRWFCIMISWPCSDAKNK